MELDRRTHRALNVNAGLSPPPRVLRSSGELITIPAGGPPLGVFADREYPCYEIELKPGDMLFSCSDGVTGVVDRLGSPFGEDRLEEILSSHAGQTADRVERALRDRLRQFGVGPGTGDDLTFVMLQRLA